MPLSYMDVLVDEEEDDEQNKRNNKNKKKKKEEDAKENRLLIFSFSKAKQRIVSKIRRKPLSLNMSSSSLPSASASASSSSGVWKYVCFCGIESPNTLEWSSSSNSGSKDDNFTIEMLRVLVQTNDFFSKDSNPHL